MPFLTFIISDVFLYIVSDKKKKERYRCTTLETLNMTAEKRTHKKITQENKQPAVCIEYYVAKPESDLISIYRLQHKI